MVVEEMPEEVSAEEEITEPELEEDVEPELEKPPKPSYFKLRIACAKELVNLLKAVAVLADEPTIMFTEDGLSRPRRAEVRASLAPCSPFVPLETHLAALSASLLTGGHLIPRVFTRLFKTTYFTY